MRTVQRSGSAIDLQGLAAAGRRADLDSAVDEFLGELLEHAADILATDTALILLCEAGSRTLAASAGDGLEHAVAQTLGLPVARDASNGTPSLVLTDVTTTDGLSPALKAGGVQSLLAVPLLSDECFLGVVVAGALDRREFTDADARVLQALADRMALEIV